MKKVLLATAMISLMLMGCTQNNQTENTTDMSTVNLTQEWDKVFPLSDKVSHRKVTFQTQYGLTLGADLDTPKASESRKANS